MCSNEDEDPLQMECNDDPIQVIKIDSDEEDDQPHCILEQLFQLPFSERNYTDQFSIVTNGRPTPMMPMLYTKTRNCVRHFKKQNYDSCPWICGCDKLNKLFCWPCLLFSDHPNQWISQGISDLNNLHNMQKRHDLMDNHIDAMLALKRFGFQVRLPFDIDTKEFNLLVKRNRHVVEKLIDITCFLAETELPFRSECEQTLKRENFTEVVNMFRMFDENFDTHFSTSNAFSRISTEMQKDLIEPTYEVLFNEIKTHVNLNKNIGFLS